MRENMVDPDQGARKAHELRNEVVEELILI